MENKKNYKKTNSSSKTNQTTNSKKSNALNKIKGLVGNKSKINKKDRPKKISKHPKLMLALRIMLIAILAMIVLGAGLITGIIFGLFGEDFKLTQEELLIEYSNSKVVDSAGNVIAELSGDENRELVSKDEMSEFLPKAFVAIEDERFYSHGGVDLKRTVAATATYVFNFGKSSFGGSTITQQLVKNITNDKEDSGLAGITRKLKEMSKSYQVERIISKDQILELYLNMIYLGGGSNNIHGVEMASQYYFTKKAKDLSVAESAFLAGITHSPSLYNPFIENPDNDKIKTRTKTVLKKMKQLNSINEEQYNQAVAEVDAGLVFTKGVISQASYSYHTEAAINQILDQLVEEKGMDREYAKRYLYSGGFTIYTTQVASVQAAIEKVHNDSTYITKSKKNKIEGTEEFATTQAATVIIDQKNGYVVGVVGGLGQKTIAFGLNRATQSIRQPGSAMKPLAIIGPALETGLINAATVVDDLPTSFGNYTPHNSYGGYKGFMNIRYMIKVSANIPEVILQTRLTPEVSIKFLKDMGITSIDEVTDNGITLALGGMTYGVSPLEMAAGYATIANDGEYIEPTFYTKVVDSAGNTVLEPNQQRRRVFSVENAYLLKSILQEPVSGGTATAAWMNNMSVAAKTGTTTQNNDVWLCEFTPYYTGATWYGYDLKEAVKGGTAAKMLGIIMRDVHTGLEAKYFQKPEGLTTAAVCKDSGMLATEACEQDPRGSRVYTESFVPGTVPSQACTCHVKVEICNDTGNIANEFCTNKTEKVFITREGIDKSKWQKAADAEFMLPTDICQLHVAPSVVEPTPEPISTPVTPEPTQTTPEPTQTTPEPTQTTPEQIPTPVVPTAPTTPETKPEENKNTNSNSNTNTNSNANTNTNTNTDTTI